MRQVPLSPADKAAARAQARPLAMGNAVLISMQAGESQAMNQFDKKVGVIVHISDPSGTNNQHNQRYLVDTSGDPRTLKEATVAAREGKSPATHILCRREELTLMVVDPSLQEIASIAHVRTEAQSVVDWFQYRLDHGDILLDAWMEPSFDAAKEILRQVNQLQQMGWNTFPHREKPVVQPKPSLMRSIRRLFGGRP